MNQQDTQAAAATLWQHWRQSTRLAQLPAQCRPETRAEGYAVQAEVARLSGQNVFGWKIAATSKAGQQHIRVDGPIAGRLLSARVVDAGAGVSLAGNNMNVVEAEFAFRMGRDLPRRAGGYRVEEVLAAVASLHPAIEVPDSRFEDFTAVGAPQLIADVACACWVAVGPAASVEWRAMDLTGHGVAVYRNGKLAGQGSGANVLGDPRAALAWIADELCVYENGLRAGDVVITGTCLTPVPVAPGDRVRADFGALGVIDLRLA